MLPSPLLLILKRATPEREPIIIILCETQREYSYITTFRDFIGHKVPDQRVQKVSRVLLFVG
jgi:hypothetical protein